MNIKINVLASVIVMAFAAATGLAPLPAAAANGTGVFVNDVELGEGKTSDIWKYEDGVLTLTNIYPYRISGANTNGDVRIVVDVAEATVRLSDLTLIYTNGINAVTFTEKAKDSNLWLAGTNTIYGVSPADDTYEAICVEGGAEVSVRVHEGMTGVLRGGYDGGDEDGGRGATRPTNYRGVWVRNGGKLVWHSGTLSSYAATIGQTGGGIAIAKGGSVTVAGGMITNCYCNAGGGAIGVREGGHFLMTGGTIIDCRADESQPIGSNFVHNHEKNETGVFAGGTFDNDPRAYSYCAYPAEHYRVHRVGDYYQVLPPICFEPVYKSVSDPQSGILYWKTNVVAVEDCAFVRAGKGATTWSNGWYVVERNTTQDGRITCEGDVHLILQDQTKLSVTGGIGVASNACLTVYVQEAGTGALTVRGVSKGHAGIGSGFTSSGPITIHGGNIDVIGGEEAAGIGGGSFSEGYDITINGGRIFAKGLEGGAGIGGGRDGMAKNIVINGGTVMAAGGAAIGGGSLALAHDITINGGSIRTLVYGKDSFIGSGGEYESRDIRIAPKTTLVFIFEPNDDLLKLDYRTSTIILPKDSILSSHLLVGDAGGWEGPSTFALTNAATHATGEITVGGGKVAFGDRNYEIPAPTANHPLKLVVTSPPTNYLEPVYNRTGEPASGISHWVTNAVENATFVTSSKYLYNLQAGWYVVEGDIEIVGRIKCRGDVHLVLKDGATLTSDSGITVLSDDARLTVYGQEEGTGKLISRATVDGAAGIGGSEYESGGGNITINGGTVEAYGAGHAAGIGGGYNGAGKNLVVNGGTVTATGGVGGAGIGGGHMKEGDGLTINGGTVTATGGGMEAAGIGGGGEKGKGKNITINGGTVTAIGGKDGGTGIGGGKGGTVENLTLNGGTIRPVAVTKEAFIGTSTFVELREAVVTVRPEALFVFDLRHGEQLAELTGITNNTVIVPERPVPHMLINGLHMGTGVATNWTVRCPATGDWADIAPGDDPVMCGPRAVALEEGWEFSLQVFGAPAVYRVPVYNEEGDPKSGIKRWEEKIHSSTGLKIVNLESRPVWKGGWYVVESDLWIDGRVLCDGEVHLIVPDGVTLTVDEGISVQATLPVTTSITIYSGPKGTGHLIADRSVNAAGIGGERDVVGGNVTINGGMIEAYGSWASAGIGGGLGGVGRNIVINGGTVKAVGSTCAAGIGGGSDVYGTNIVINGGYVMARGGKRAAAIGGGASGEGRDITLNGGTVVATVDVDYELPGEFSPTLIGSGLWAASPMGVRISKDVILVYDLLRQCDRPFRRTYDRPTLITHGVSEVQSAGFGIVPDAEGNWTGPETFLVTNVDTYATAEIKVNGPSIDWGNKKVRLAYRPKPGGLMLCPATDHTGVFVNGAEIGPEYSAEEREKMGWWYDKANKVAHIRKGGDFRFTGCNVDGDVRFIVEASAHLILDRLTLIYPGDNGNAFTIGNGVQDVRATLVGINNIYGHAVNAEAVGSEPDQEREAVFRVSGGAVLTVYDGGDGILYGNASDLYCATWVCSGGQLFWSGGTAVHYHTICWSLGSAVCQCGVFDHNPIESKDNGFVLGKHSQITEIDGLFYVYSYWYEEPVYRTPGDPKSGIDRWETNILDRAQCVVLSSKSSSVTIGSGWNVVEKDCRIAGQVRYNGDVRLFVADGATLSIAEGLTTTNDASRLTIYGQGYREGLPTGKIVCNGVEGRAAIGGAAVMPGGETAPNPGAYGGEGNNITINGCAIEATAVGGGAVIGGFFWHDATNIVINGGWLNLSVTNEVYNTGAAIIGGGGYAGETFDGGEGRGIVINGGTINDLSPEGSAGIGCGKRCKDVWPAGNRNLVVNGGSINASVGDEKHKPCTTLYRIVDTNNIPNVGPLEIAGLGTYGVRDIFPAKLTNDVSQLTFYLPEPSGTYWVNGVCHAYRNGGATDAKPYSPEEAASFDTEEEARAYAETAYMPRPNKDVEGVISAVDYNAMFKFIFRESANTTWSVEPVLKVEVIEDVTEAIEDETVTALLAASVTNAVPQTVLWTRAGLYYGIGGSTDVKDAGEVPSWLLGDGGIQTLEGAKPAAATDKAFYRIRVTPQP